MNTNTVEQVLMQGGCSNILCQSQSLRGESKQGNNCCIGAVNNVLKWWFLLYSYISWKQSHADCSEQNWNMYIFCFLWLPILPAEFLLSVTYFAQINWPNLSRPRFEALTLLAMALLCLVLLPVVGSWCSRAKGGGACSCPLGGGEWGVGWGRWRGGLQADSPQCSTSSSSWSEE